MTDQACTEYRRRVGRRAADNTQEEKAVLKALHGLLTAPSQLERSSGDTAAPAAGYRFAGSGSQRLGGAGMLGPLVLVDRTLILWRSSAGSYTLNTLNASTYSPVITKLGLTTPTTVAASAARELFSVGGGAPRSAPPPVAVLNWIAWARAMSPMYSILTGEHGTARLERLSRDLLQLEERPDTPSTNPRPRSHHDPTRTLAPRQWEPDGLWPVFIGFPHRKNRRSFSSCLGSLTTSLSRHGPGRCG